MHVFSSSGCTGAGGENKIVVQTYFLHLCKSATIKNTRFSKSGGTGAEEKKKIIKIQKVSTPMPDNHKSETGYKNSTGSPFRHRVTVSTPPVRSSAIHKGGGFSMTVYTTSSASPTSVGGGGSGHYTGNGGSHRTSSPGLNYNIPSLAIVTAMPSTSSMVESAQERLTGL